MKFLDNNGLEYLAGKIVGLVSGVGSADYIMEEDVSGIWRYRKWASGIAECWGIWSGSLTHYSTPTTGLYGYYVVMGLPAIFLSNVLPVIQVTAGVGNGFAWSGASMPNTYTGTSFNAYAISTLSGTNTVTFNMTVKGLWKAFDPNSMRSATLDTYYPVGSIYMTVNNINPANLFGGTWEQIKDKFLLSAGNTYSAGSTGGEATHTLTKNEMPAHGHSLNAYAASSGGSGGGVINYNNNAGGAQYIAYDQGGGQAHNNMPPYLTVYVWKRTA